MAIDTRDKRFSLLGLGQAHGSPWVLPNPTGAFETAPDRAQLVYLYRGVIPGELADGGDDGYMLLRRRRA